MDAKGEGALSGGLIGKSMGAPCVESSLPAMAASSLSDPSSCCCACCTSMALQAQQLVAHLCSTCIVYWGARALWKPPMLLRCAKRPLRPVSQQATCRAAAADALCSGEIQSALRRMSSINSITARTGISGGQHCNQGECSLGRPLPEALLCHLTPVTAHTRTNCCDMLRVNQKNRGQGNRLRALTAGSPACRALTELAASSSPARQQ